MKLSDPRLLAAGVCIATAAWLGSGYLNAPEKKTINQSAENRRPYAVQVRVSVAEQREDIARVFGQTQAGRRVDIRAELDGRVTDVAVERGASVAAGALLIRIAPDERNAQLAEARALLAQYQAELEATRILVSKGNRAELDITAARARLESARALVARIEVELARTVVRAPFAGVIETRAVEIGSYLRAGDPVATLIDLDPIRIIGSISEREVGRLTVGKNARARLLNGQTLTGKIAYLATVADSATRTFRVEIEVPNPKNQIVEGLTTELQLPLGNITAHRISPAILNLNDEGRLGVKIVNAEQKVEFFPTQIVATSPEAMWISGLPPRVSLIVVGQDFVNPGQSVRPVE